MHRSLIEKLWCVLFYDMISMYKEANNKIIGIRGA